MNPFYISLILIFGTGLLAILWARLYFTSPFNILQNL